jgi:hypothetical protein
MKHRMTTNTPQREPSEQRGAVIDWLLDSDPSIGWQVRSDLMNECSEIVGLERSRVATEGWGYGSSTFRAPTGIGVVAPLFLIVGPPRWKP